MEGGGGHHPPSTAPPRGHTHASPHLSLFLLIILGPFWIVTQIQSLKKTSTVAPWADTNVPFLRRRNSQRWDRNEIITAQ